MMCKNYNKEGYSTKDVAQILGCHPATVNNMIDDGRLKALIKEPTYPNGRRTIRITRDQLTDYLDKNKSRYSKELLQQFGISKDEPAKTDEIILLSPVEFLDELYDIKNPKTGSTVFVKRANAYFRYSGASWDKIEATFDMVAAQRNAQTTPIPTGAWAHLLQPETEPDAEEEESAEVGKAEEAPSPVPKHYIRRRLPYYYGEERKPRRCSILVDGRIAVANVTEYTASDIFASLMRDEYMSVHSIEIKFEEVK